MNKVADDQPDSRKKKEKRKQFGTFELIKTERITGKQP